MSAPAAKHAHTPGKWEISQQDGLHLFVVAKGEAIAECFRVEQTGGFDATLFANACLIAAAPDLLEALQRLMKATGHSLCSDAEAWFKAEAAIARATGEGE